MATYTGIASTELDADSPVTDTLMARLDANPHAMFEGASGAPRLAFEALGAWYITAGGLGTYVFAKRTTGTTDVAFGSTLAGSSLSPTSSVAFWASVSTTASFATGSALSGTWQAMGYYDYTAAGDSSGAMEGATLWLRVA